MRLISVSTCCTPISPSTRTINETFLIPTTFLCHPPCSLIERLLKAAKSANMAAAFTLRASDRGLPVPGKGTEVAMSWNHRAILPTTPARPGDTLWTQSMSDCCSVATFDRGTRARSLVHLQGGFTDDQYFETMASRTSADTTIILVAGGFWSQFALDNFGETYKENLEAAMRKAGKSVESLEWVRYWGNDVIGHERNERPTGFVFRADGLYGIIDPRLPAEKEDAKCCVIN